MGKSKFAVSSDMPGGMRWISEDEKRTLTLFERLIVKAIEHNHIFCVFQPITDMKRQMQGAEILVRWRMNDEVISPSQFLPKIQSSCVWMLLTTYVLKEAVDTINYFKGKYYFSINIPPEVTYSGRLLEMMAKGCASLADPRWANRLVLEMSEATNFSSINMQKILSDLSLAGFQVLLDDCFSQGSVMFPVRHIKFNGFKLDMSIVSNFQNDTYDLNLIKSLLYFCDLNGATCIAEGVDNESKFNSLIKIGVNNFQGYMISPPLDLESLKSKLPGFTFQNNPSFPQ